MVEKVARLHRHGGHRRPLWWQEVMIGLVVLACYSLVSAMDSPSRHHAAMANSRALYQVEEVLHLDLEPALNHWLAPRGVLRVVANYVYATTYVIGAVALLAWLYFRRPAAYPWARTSFMMMNLIAIGCFAVFPMAPPRLVADLGFVDTVLQERTWGSWGSPMVSHANELAAMPSLHLAWALWVSLVLAAVGARRVSLMVVGQALSGLHVLATTIVVMATANHYLLDAVAGAGLSVACVASTRRLANPPS